MKGPLWLAMRPRTDTPTLRFRDTWPWPGGRVLFGLSLPEAYKPVCTR